MKKEIWKPINGFELSYSVSSIGRVKALKRQVKHNYGGFSIKSERILTPLNINGYSRVVLCKNNEQFFKSVHRLVGIAFIPNPENKPFINHKNGVKNDNRVENLEWCTCQENIIHAYKNGLSKKGNKHYNYGKIGCNAIFGKCSTSGEILSVFQLSKRYNVSTVHIRRMLNGERTNKTTFLKTTTR